MRQKPACVISPAKLNLGLRIVGRRGDGYHLLESLFWPLELQDEMLLAPSESTSVRTAWANNALRPSLELPPEQENLLYRAAIRALKSGKGLEMHLIKQIPMGAGLGGGSSNAGSFLRYLVDVGSLEQTSAEAIALELGADVPFFLNPTPAWVEGIGEKREPIVVAPEVTDGIHFLLVLPPVETPTPLLFGKYRRLGLPFAKTAQFPTNQKIGWKELRTYLKSAENSLQGLAAMEAPVLGELLAKLDALPALYSGLSGTGSTCFAVFESEAAAKKGAKALQTFCRKNDCRSTITRSWRQHGNHRG